MFDFPASPVLGQLYQGYAWDGEKWAASGTPAPIAVLQGYLFGCTMSTPGASTSMTVQPGFACDSTGSRIMKLLASTTKTTGAWAAGNAGGLDTGTIANNAWYHWHIIQNTTSGVVDVLFSLSATAPTLPIGYSAFRRIGSMKTNASGQWLGFSQLGDEFLWATASGDVYLNGTLSITAQIVALSVPLVIKPIARLRGFGFSVNGGTGILVTSPDEADQTTGSPFGNYTCYMHVASTYNSWMADVRVDASSQVRVRANGGSSTIAISTYGWIDTRGRLN